MPKTPTERRVETLELKLALATKTLSEAKFAIDSAIMLSGLAALVPYAESIDRTMRDLAA